MIRIANAPGCYGDRLAAVQLTGDELDMLTGDYLAELTMVILDRDLLKESRRGYATTILRQPRENLTPAADGRQRWRLNLAGLADELGVEAAAHHGWARDDYDLLAGGAAARCAHRCPVRCCGGRRGGGAGPP